MASVPGAECKATGVRDGEKVRLGSLNVGHSGGMYQLGSVGKKLGATGSWTVKVACTHPAGVAKDSKAVRVV